jgi:hypothetical protein
MESDGIEDWAMGKPGFHSSEVADVLATVHPWIRLVVRGYYVPAVATASGATREAVIDLDIAGKTPSADVATFVRYIAHAANRMPELRDALAPDDLEDSLNRLLDPATAVARVLNLDPKSVFFPILNIISTMDRAITAVTIAAGELFDAVSGALDPDGGMGGSLAIAIDRGRDLDRALSDLLYALNDFTGSDLRDVDLAAISLGGVVWSETTRWPPHAHRRVMRDSVPIGGGIFGSPDVSVGR